MVSRAHRPECVEVAPDLMRRTPHRARVQDVLQDHAVVFRERAFSRAKNELLGEVGGAAR
jgi:hypothetical protein